MQLTRLWSSFVCRYVYERLTPPGRKPTFMTLMVTQLVSGVWHGLYPGYIMFFAGSAIFFAHSTVIYNWEKAFMPQWVAKNPVWWAMKVFSTKQGLDFLAMAFLWLTWKECVAAWASVYYLPLLYMITVLILGALFPVKKQKQKVDGEGVSSSTAAAAKEAAAAAAAAAGSGKAFVDGHEVVTGDHFSLGEGIKSALVDGAASKPGSYQDLINGPGLKQE